MTLATPTHSQSLVSGQPLIYYQVELPQPESHLFEVQMQVSIEQLISQGLNTGILDVKMPVWTPGSYLVREYARHLQEFTAFDPSENPISVCKVAKNHWQLSTRNVEEITIKYRVFANELTVRTNHLDSSHGYFNGAALFLYIPGYESHPISVEIIPPSNWQVTTVLPQLSDKKNTFIAENFDVLVDTPFEIGQHQTIAFEAAGKSHEIAIWGEGNADAEKMIPDFQKIIETESNLFGGLPYEHYLFLLHLSGSGYGGLEHKACCTLNYPRFGFRDTEKYNRFLQLVAHEFFHLWNVKRIRPKALETFDYDQENYTPSLWFCEGTTSYYDLLIPLRAKIYDAQTFLKALSKDITRLQTIPGRNIQPLNESSWDAWIKLYRRDANSDNNQISYYLKGQLVSLLLDLLIRNRHNHQKSLDNVMVQMWQQFGQPEIGYTPDELKKVIESVAEMDLTDFFEQFIYSTTELPYNQYLETVGLQLKAETTDTAPRMGIKVVSDTGVEKIQFVESGSPAEAAGVESGDELLAINGFRVKADQISDRLQDFQPGDRVELTLFHQDQLRTCQLTLTSPQPNLYKIVSLDQPSPESQRNFTQWLGCAYQKL
ncbi:MAG: M61 family metallopeptidase [Microcoleaceae cyanobacterium]